MLISLEGRVHRFCAVPPYSQFESKAVFFNEHDVQQKTIKNHCWWKEELLMQKIDFCDVMYLKQVTLKASNNSKNCCVVLCVCLCVCEPFVIARN